jgi:hypothetical protein
MAKNLLIMILSSRGTYSLLSGYPMSTVCNLKLSPIGHLESKTQMRQFLFARTVLTIH